MIVAMGENNEIGNKENDMPWHIPDDLQHFKNTTMKYPIIMGRKTYESIGRILPGRENVIISRNMDYQIEDAVHFSDFYAALDYYKEKNYEKVFIIGGGQIFKLALNSVDNIYLTRIHHKFQEGSVFFPELPEHFQMIEEEKHSADEKNPYDYSFQIWKNMKNA